MKTTHKIAVFVLLLLVACINNRGDAEGQVVRVDTTINRQNAYNQLTIDSLQLSVFLGDEVHNAADSVAILNFYNSRNYQYAWFDERGLTEQARIFWNLHEADEHEQQDSLRASRALHYQMIALVNSDTITLSRIEELQTELRLTRHFFTYMNHAAGGSLDPEAMQWYIPRRKVDVRAVLDSFLSGSQPHWLLQNKAFVLLQNSLLQYVQVAAHGGWPIIAIDGKVLKKGDTGRVVSLLCRRLAAAQLYNNSPASVFDDSVQAAVKKAQQSFGLALTGVVNAELVAELNVPVEERIKQLKINLERMRWMPNPGKDRLVANIPGFTLHVVQNDSLVMNIPIVVGKAATRTVIFSDQLQYIVFSPYWNVPASIVQNEILPALRRNPNYLAKNNMEKIGISNGLPVIRQLPGGNNSLGRVKFLFPNPYNIYFHDTPAKALFSRDQRAFSHGCIRLKEPVKLAEYLLRSDTAWTSARIKESMNQTKEKWVALIKPVPVYVTYFTSWVDEHGLLNFRKDLYGHDARMAGHLFK